MSCVSVIIPAYNKAAYTRQAVDSVLAQDYSSVELIVVDDGSTDETQEVLQSYGSRLIYVRKVNGGACSARNVGLSRATGEWVAFLDCDDLYRPKKISQSVAFLKSNPSYGFVYTAADFINREGQVVGQYDHARSRHTGWIYDHLLKGNMICNSTVVARRDIVMKAGGFDERFFMPADWDMWLRLARLAPAGYLAEYLSAYRVTDNYILNRLPQAYQEEHMMLEKQKTLAALSDGRMAQLLSDCDVRFAQAYYVKDDREQAKQLIKLAISRWPFHFKAWVMLFLMHFAGQWLSHELKRKIIRTT